MKYRAMVREEITYLVDVDFGDDPHTEDDVGDAIMEAFKAGEGSESDSSEPWIVSITTLPELG